MIVHTLPAIGVEHEGPANSVPALCEALIACGVETTLAVLDLFPQTPAPPYVKRFPLSWGPRKLGRSPAMARYLIDEVRSGRAEVIHSHGLWTMPNVYPGWARKSGACRLVVSPRGMVSEWALAHKALKKKLFWHLLQARTMRRADAFHATAEAEHADLRLLGFQQPVCVLPNGIDVPPLTAPPVAQRRRLLYLGRIHKIKGVDNLLHAWKAVEARFPDWELVVAGPDSGGYLTEYRALAERLRLPRVSFPGPLYRQAKLDAYRAASLYVLPTHSENFAMTVAESLAAGTAVIVTRGAPWRGLVEHDAGWWIEIGVDPLVAALEQALALPEERLRAMGRNGRAWMEREFSWRAIGEEMAQFYRWLAGDGSRPACVRPD
jgi:glycosyltransferase involved in cell wall biosynthesis